MTPYIGICRWYNGVCYMALVRDRGGNENDITKEQYQILMEGFTIEGSINKRPTR